MRNWREVNDPPENYLLHPNNYYLLVRLNNGKVIRANRNNGYWFGMWRWLHDDEIKSWTWYYY